MNNSNKYQNDVVSCGFKPGPIVSSIPFWQ